MSDRGWSFTDRKTHSLTTTDLAVFRKIGRELRCGLCGHRFAEGDSCRWIYMNSDTPSAGNFFACPECDGPDVKLKRARWMLRAATEFHEIYSDKAITAEHEGKIRDLISRLERAGGA